MKRLLRLFIGGNVKVPSSPPFYEHHTKAAQLIAEGNVLEEQGQFVKAESYYREALRLRPELARAWINLGNVQWAQQQPYQAAASYREALRLDPGYGAAHANLGRLYLERKDPDIAVEHYSAAIAALPDSVDALYGLGNALEALARFKEAIDAYERGLAIQPEHVPTKLRLANLLMASKRLDEAARHLKDLLVLLPSDEDNYFKLAGTLAQQDHLTEAEEYYRQAWGLRPDCALYLVNALLLLPVIPQSMEDIRYWRRRFEEGISTLYGTRESYTLGEGKAFSISFNLAYHGLNNRPIMESLFECFRDKFPELNFSSPHLEQWKAPSLNRRIRIGVLSDFLRSHSVGAITEGMIRHLNPSRFEVVIIHASENYRQDVFRQQLDASASRVVVLPSANLIAMQDCISKECLDVLFYPEIGMSPLTYLLAFSRLAPVQAVTWGHPDTTGLDTMDYFVSFAPFEPVDAEDHYSERLIRLNRLGYYNPPAPPTQILHRNELGLPETGTLYGCLQSLFKIHPEFDAILAAIAQGDPSGWIVMSDNRNPAWVERLKTRWARFFPLLGKRILFMPWLPLERYMALLAQMDVLLEPIHFGGGTSMYQSMVYGIPIVTWPGKFARGRFVMAAYQQMGVSDAPVVERLDDYAPMALTLGQNPELRRALRQRLLEAGKTLIADLESVREIEIFLEAAVTVAGRGQKLPVGWRPH